MLNDNRDKELQRNQLLAILLMTGMVLVWTFFFLPSPPPPGTVPAPGEATGEGEPVPQERQTGREEGAVAPTAVPGGAPVPSQIPLPPPAPLPDSPEADEVRLSNDHLAVVLTRVGARLKRAEVKLGKDGADSIQLVPTVPGAPDAEAEYPLGLLFSDPQLGDALNTRRWETEGPGPDGTVRFTLELPGFARLAKTFALAPDSHVLRVNVEYTHLGEGSRLLGLDRKEPAFSLFWGPNVSSDDLTKGTGQSIVLRRDGANTYVQTLDLELPRGPAWYNERILDPEWAAICSAYFTVALKPEFEHADAWYHGSTDYFRLGVGFPRVELATGETATGAYQVYIGPRGLQALQAAWPTLDTVFSFFPTVGFMDAFAKLLLVVLVWFHDTITPNYGLAIIFLTVLVRVVMFPLTWKSMLSMKKMSKLAPEIEKLKAELGDNQQEMQKRMMELYRERGVSPLGGCLPMLLQAPVFIALYRMLWSAFELRRAPFVAWITDLSEPDRLFLLPFSIPLPFTTQTIDSFNLLPILMAAAMVVSQKLMPMTGPMQNQQQKVLMAIMPVIFALFTYNMASGLNLYILVSTLLGIAQNYLVHGIDVDIDPVKKKKPSRPRHFYDVIRLKKREMEKEVRKQKQQRQQQVRKDSRTKK